jgi:hypothetical protein
MPTITVCCVTHFYVRYSIQHCEAFIFKLNSLRRRIEPHRHNRETIEKHIELCLTYVSICLCGKKNNFFSEQSKQQYGL